MDSGPPPIPPRPPGYTHPTAAPPPLPPRRVQSQQRPDLRSNSGPSPASQPESTWTALLYADGAATPLFDTLMTAVLARLDPGNTGYLSPESVADLMDLQGFRLEHNVWKANLKANAIFAAEDMADYELKACYEAWGFDHKVVVREPTRPRLPHGGMPLLSRAGLIDLMAVESAREPERAWRGLNAVLQYYSLWPAMGPLPRHALPREPPPLVLQRQDHATARYLRAAQERLDAARVEASIRAQGRQAAIEISSPYTYYYY